jgi:hypothetical protein
MSFPLLRLFYAHPLMLWLSILCLVLGREVQGVLAGQESGSGGIIIGEVITGLGFRLLRGGEVMVMSWKMRRGRRRRSDQ